MNNEAILKRIKEIVSFYEESLNKARQSGKLDVTSREMINSIRQSALAEIFELMKGYISV